MALCVCVCGVCVYVVQAPAHVFGTTPRFSGAHGYVARR
jgi:hypothetical protein